MLVCTLRRAKKTLYFQVLFTNLSLLLLHLLFFVRRSRRGQVNVMLFKLFTMLARMSADDQNTNECECT